MVKLAITFNLDHYLLFMTKTWSWVSIVASDNSCQVVLRFSQKQGGIFNKEDFGKILRKATFYTENKYPIDIFGEMMEKLPSLPTMILQTTFLTVMAIASFHATSTKHEDQFIACGPLYD